MWCNGTTFNSKFESVKMYYKVGSWGVTYHFFYQLCSFFEYFNPLLTYSFSVHFAPCLSQMLSSIVLQRPKGTISAPTPPSYYNHLQQRLVSRIPCCLFSPKCVRFWIQKDPSLVVLMMPCMQKLEKRSWQIFKILLSMPPMYWCSPKCCSKDNSKPHSWQRAILDKLHLTVKLLNRKLFKTIKYYSTTAIFVITATVT